MNWLSILLLAIRYLPEIISVVKAIIALINLLPDRRLAKAEMQTLSYNVETAVKTKDFAVLDAQYDRLKKRCRGEEC